MTEQPISRPETQRVAAIDCGTNSLRLLIADVTGTTSLRDVERRMQIVRLGQGVDATGRFAPAALARALAVTEEYAASCREHGADRIRFVATSASRDAADAHLFTDGVRRLVGIDPEVISGEEEARLSFLGATRGLAVAGDQVLVVDIGGGSTEFVLGDPASGRPEAASSVDVGCVRLTERHLLGDAAAARPDRTDTPVDLEAVRADAEAALDAAARVVPLEKAGALVGLAGSVTTLTAHALGLPDYDSERIHGAVQPIPDLIAACQDMISRSREQRAALPYLHPGRVDVIVAGAVIWQSVLERLHRVAGLTHAVTSEHDILDGIAWTIAGR